MNEHAGLRGAVVVQHPPNHVALDGLLGVGIEEHGAVAKAGVGRKGRMHHLTSDAMGVQRMG